MYTKYEEIKDQLEIFVKESFSWSDVCKKIGKSQRTGAQSHIKKVCMKMGFDFSHFTGQAWRRGKIFKKRDIEDYLSNKVKINSHSLKIKLIQSGLKEEKCECCGISKWLEEPVVLELDHIDSNHLNNNLDNLQIICPNCHATLTRNRSGCRKGYSYSSPIKKEKMKNEQDGRSLRLIRLELRKVKNRPSVEILIAQVKELGYAGTGRLYNVSDNAIRKWIKRGDAEKVDNSVLEAGAK